MRFEISPERASRIHLWVLVPTRTLSCYSPHHIDLMNALREHGINSSWRSLPGDSLVTRSRNNLADIFLNESSDDDNHYSLWLDDDVIFSPTAVLEMLACDKDFIAAPYTKKGLHMDRMAAAARLGWKSNDIVSVAGTPNVNFIINQVRLNEPVPVLEAGSGFWLIKRKVFRMMVEEMPHIRYRRLSEERAHYGREYAHDFFRVGVWPETGEYISEDWWFCREWRNMGGTVWCAFWVITHHLGPYMYPMNMDAIIGLLTQTKGYIHGSTWGNEDGRQTDKAAVPSDTSTVGG